MGKVSSRQSVLLVSGGGHDHARLGVYRSKTVARGMTFVPSIVLRSPANFVSTWIDFDSIADCLLLSRLYKQGFVNMPNMAQPNGQLPPPPPPRIPESWVSAAEQRFYTAAIAGGLQVSCVVGVFFRFC